jgi:hypothetical protein
VWLPWTDAAVLALVLAVATVVARRSRRRWVGIGAAFSRELSIILCLYAIWQLAGTLSIMKVTRAMSRGEAIYRFERLLHLPSEASVQHAVLPHPLLVQAANGYYAIVHAPALGIFLVWLFVRHRARYPRVRNTIAILTGVSLLIQLVPVAPPRMFPNLGFVDTGLVYGQSVYTALGRGMADQLSAMPSVHVGWAVVIGLAVVHISPSRWRWLVLAHPVLTVLVVVITANHYWLDGIVEVVILAAAVVFLRLASRAWTHHRARVAVAPVGPLAPPVPSLELVGRTRA